MNLIMCATGNPLAQRFYLSRTESSLGIRRWHPLGFIARGDAVYELAQFGFARDHGRVAGVATANCCFPHIQAKSGFARLLIRTMTTKAIISQDWSNIV